MNLEQARAVRDNSISETRAHLALALDCALRELDKVQAHSLEQERLRTLGGVPPVPQPWINRTIEPPASASDPSAPPLWRSAPRLIYRTVPTCDGPQDAA